MSMALPTTTAGAKTTETSLMRRQRLRREAEERSRPLSKAEQAAKEAAEREKALSTSLDSSNKGAKMLAKLGFKGGALGKQGGEGRTEPIAVEMREGRGGIGIDEDRKRKVREAVDGQIKRQKVDEGEYRERMRREREVKRLEGQIIGAQKIAERFDDGDGEGDSTINGKAEDIRENSRNLEDGNDDEKADAPAQASKPSKPLRSINVLWRGLPKFRLQKERDRNMRHDLQQSLSRLPTYDDPDEDKDYKQAFGTEVEDLDEEDQELDEFNSLEPEERLSKLVAFLRQQYQYCFWCKFRYPDANLEGCPGVTEEDHD